MNQGGEIKSTQDVLDRAANLLAIARRAGHKIAIMRDLGGRNPLHRLELDDLVASVDECDEVVTLLKAKTRGEG